MCGILGIISNREPDHVIARARQGIAAQSHRGPDDEGIEMVGRDPLVVFAHRRLSIQDLTPAGHQPMRNESTGDWITFNGEVFNFRELRPRLQARGVAFHSDSDTELILKAFSLHGEAAIADWRGMFAFGLWQAEARRLTLVRDRLGIKPLYYFHDGETFVFGSEIRALLATGLVPRRISQAALDSYLAYGSIQQPLTILEGIYSVLPGHILSFQGGRIEQHPYWTLRARAIARMPLDREAIGEEIAAQVAEAVRLRLISDVPVGLFLSGGIDSSAITALARRATNGNLKSFSICFREQEFSEQPYAEQIARQYETEHQTVFVTEDEILSKLPRALSAMDQPSIDGVNTWIVSEAAANAGLKVALSGCGGDEVFAGYGFFRTIARDEQLRAQASNVPRALRRAAGMAIGAIGSGTRAAKLGALLESDAFGEHALELYRQLFTARQRQALQNQDIAESTALRGWRDRQWQACAAADPVNQASALELGRYLTNTLLRDTDAMSMHHSLEVRVPLLDHKLVERMLEFPGSFKLDAATPKWLLVRAAGDLPREIIDRPKRGFELPFRLWLAGALRPPMEAMLQSRAFCNLLDSDAMQKVWRDFLAGRTTWSRAWALYVLGDWMERHLS